MRLKRAQRAIWNGMRGATDLIPLSQPDSNPVPTNKSQFTPNHIDIPGKKFE